MTSPIPCFNNPFTHIVTDVKEAVLGWATAGGTAFSSILLH